MVGRQTLEMTWIKISLPKKGLLLALKRSNPAASPQIPCGCSHHRYPGDFSALKQPGGISFSSPLPESMDEPWSLRTLQESEGSVFLPQRRRILRDNRSGPTSHTKKVSVPCGFRPQAEALIPSSTFLPSARPAPAGGNASRANG